jgi:hypothetical protein
MVIGDTGDAVVNRVHLNMWLHYDTRYLMGPIPKDHPLRAIRALPSTSHPTWRRT